MRFPRIFGGPKPQTAPLITIESPEDLARLAEQNETVQGILKTFENNRTSLQQQAAFGGRTADDVLVEKRQAQAAADSLRAAGFIVDASTIESF